MHWTEVPITMRYPPAGKRCSNIKPFKGWYEMLKPFMVARFNHKGYPRLSPEPLSRPRPVNFPAPQKEALGDIPRSGRSR